MKQMMRPKAGMPRRGDPVTQERSALRPTDDPMGAGSPQPLGEAARRILQVQESERRRIARELHDEFGQRLTGLKFDLAWLRTYLARQPPSTVTASLVTRTETMALSIDALMVSVRNTATSLHPSILDDLGLLPALEWLVSDFHARTNIQCHADLDQTLSNAELPMDIATALYRIIQELLTNVARHAEASSVHITLTRTSDRLALELIDDGRGIGQQSGNPKHSFGLRGIRERISMLGGTTTIVGQPGLGTKVSIIVPHETIIEDPVGFMHGYVHS